MEIFYLCVTLVLIAAAVFVWVKGHNILLFAGVSVAATLLTLAVYPIVYSIERSDKQTFYEYWNGHELSADQHDTQCVRDGSCRNTYDCDPYLVTRTEYYTDSNGNSQSRTVTDTEYHSCPYSSVETTWSVNTSLGEYTILDSAMTGEPYRAGKDIPGGMVISPPEFWVQAKERIDAGEPSGVTARKSYSNFILSSDNTIFKQHESDIPQFLEEGVLPAPLTDVHSFYMADKTYYAGVDDLVDWGLREDLDSALQNLNGRAGSEVTADIHAVFVDGSLPADLYTSTLHSYWVSPEHGRNAIAKNALVVVFGVDSYSEPETVESASDVAPVDGVTAVEEVSEVDVSEASEGDPVVVWARAFTGMPVGNEELIQAVTDMEGHVVDAQLIGKPFYDAEAGSYVESEVVGELESLVFAPETRYERVSMSADDSEDVGGGFKYLGDSYVLSTGGMVAVHLISLFVIVLASGFAFVKSMRYD